MARSNYFGTIILLVCLQHSVLRVSAQTSWNIYYLTDLCQTKNANIKASYFRTTILLHRDYEPFPSNLDCRVTIQPSSIPPLNNDYENGIELMVDPERNQHHANIKCEEYRVELFQINSNSINEVFLDTTKCLADGPITFGIATLVHIHFHFNNDTLFQSPSGFSMSFRNEVIYKPRPPQPPTTREPNNRSTISETPTFVYILAIVIPTGMVIPIAYGCYKKFQKRPSTASAGLRPAAAVQSNQVPVFHMVTQPVPSEVSNQQSYHGDQAGAQPVHREILNQESYPEDHPPPYPNDSPPPYQSINPSAPFQENLNRGTLDKPIYHSLFSK